MNKIIGVTELQRKFRAVFDDVVHHQTPYVLTRGSRPEAVMMPYEQYIELVKRDEAGVHERFDKLLARMAKVNAKYSNEEIAADLQKATRIVRARRHERARQQGTRPVKTTSPKARRIIR